tara:strand:- start:632 stop:958 length:327 start_codon:yes stop_codon:yes gene_type:complete
MKKIIPKFPYVDYEYREADENAVDIQHLINFVYTMDSNLAQRIEEFGIYVPEYENRIQRYRNTLEMAYEFMFVGHFQAKTPQKTIKRFKNAINRVKETVRRNKYERDN